MNDSTGLISKQVQFYKDLGIKTVPLKPRTKEVFISGWYEKSHEELWSQGFNFNVGIQLDGELICIDADDDKTVKLFDSILKVYNPPIVKTRGGQHYYFRATDGQWDVSYRKIKGKYNGEIRLQNCYVVAPPSFVLADNYKDTSLGHCLYEVISGNFENIPTIPKEVVDMWVRNYCIITITSYNKKEIISVDEAPIEQLGSFTKLQVPLFRRNWRTMKHLVDKIDELNDNENPKLTYGSVTYKSRSEVFQSAIVTFKLCGYTDREILDIAIDNNLVLEPKKVNYHVSLSCSHADTYIVSKKIIKTLHKLYFQELDVKHSNDKLVYKALVSIGVQFSTLTPYLSKTQFRKITGILNYRSLKNSLNRLSDSNYIEKINGDKYELVIGEPVAVKESVYLSSSWFTNNGITTNLNIEKILGNSYKILIFLNTGEKLSSEIYKNITLGKRSIINQLNKLMKLGLIIKTKVGKNVTYRIVPDIEDILYNMSINIIQKNAEKINQDIVRLNGWRAESLLYYELKRLGFDRNDVLDFITDGRNQDSWFTEMLIENTLDDMVELFKIWKDNSTNIPL